MQTDPTEVVSSGKAAGVSSYGQILKSSSIVGSAQVVVFAISLIKTKVAAVLLGPSGVGLIGLYQSLVVLVASVSGMGLNTSGVREVAGAHASGKSERVAKTAAVLLRLSFLTGAAGCLLMIILSWPLSKWTFESPKHALGIAVLGSVVILGAVCAAQAAILQGLRRVSDLARINLACAATASLVSVAFYALLHEKGIVPAMVLSAVLGLGIHLWYLHKAAIRKVRVTWHETFARSGSLLRLGVAMAWSGLMFSGVTALTRTLIVRDLGLDANGYYQAAWTISGLFSGILISAMGADFFPRLTAAGHDNQKVNTLVNQQTEIAILLATPPVVGTILFAPLLIGFLFSKGFAMAVPLVPVLMTGVFIQLLVWPLGYIFLAREMSKMFAVVETCMSAFHGVAIIVCLQFFGLMGVATAFMLKMVVHTVVCLVVFRKKTGFFWSGQTLKVVRECLLILAISLTVYYLLQGAALSIVAIFVTLFASIYCLRSVVHRLDPASKFAMILRNLPLSGFLFR